MALSQKAIEDFRQAYFKEFNEEISDAEAKEMRLNQKVEINKILCPK